jgi:molecular chaperone Hsp33
MNTRTRFLFKELDIRGQHLSMSEAWQAMIENRSYSRQVRQLLGELSALAIMLTSGMKHKGNKKLLKRKLLLIVMVITHNKTTARALSELFALNSPRFMGS